MNTSRFFSSKILVATLAVVMMAGCSAKNKRARLLARAERYFNAGEYDKAKIEYLNLLRHDPQNPKPFQQLGLIWFEQGAPLRAAPFLLRARELAPANLENRGRMARVFIAVGELAAARKEALTMLQPAPDNGEGILLLAETARSQEEMNETERQLQKFPQRNSVAFHLASATLALRRGNPATAQNRVQQAITLDPKSSSAHLMMATFHLFQKNPQKAEQEFKTAAELAPVRSNERLKYAAFKAQAGATNEATAILKELTAKAPDYIPAWTLLGRIAFSEKKFDETLALLENVFNRDAENIEARMLQSEARLAKGETKSAVDGLERLDKTYANVPAIKGKLARSYLENNNPIQAAAALTQAITAQPDYVEGILLLAEINLRAGDAQAVAGSMVDLLKKHPGQPQALAHLAQAYRMLGRLDDAAAVVQERLRRAPQDSQAHLLLGLILRQQDKHDEAQKAFESAQQFAPENLSALDALVILDIEAGEFDRAMQRVEEQIAKTPDSATAHCLQGKIYAVQAKAELAEAAFLKALELDPSFTRAYDMLISNYIAANNLPQAISGLQTLLSKKPDNQAALMVSGLVYERMNDFARARDAYEKLLLVKPDFVLALNNLAYLYSEHFNLLDRALEMARKARALQPADPALADTLGWVLYKMGDYQAALTLLEESAEKLPDNPEVQFHFGMAGYMMGRTEVAQRAFRKAVDATVDFPGKDEAQRRLTMLGESAGGPTEQSTEELEGILKQQPNDLIALVRLGEAYEKQGDFAKSAAAFERALKVNPRLASAAVKLAQFHAGPLQNKEKALEYAKKARELVPNDPKVTGILGGLIYQSGNFAWAYSLLQESARQLPGDTAILHNYAWAAYSLGRVIEARELMQRFVAAAPASPQSDDGKLFLALTVPQQPTDGTAAEAEAQKLLQSNPEYVPALMIHAAGLTRRGDSKTAAGIFGDVLRRFPDFAPAQKGLAAWYAQDPGNLAKAYDLAVKARKTLADDPELDQVLAEISYQKKEYPRAVQLLQESGRKKPLDAKGLYVLGMSQLQTKQVPQGRETLDRALTSGLQEPLATEAKRVVAELQKK
jgi:tetratricopeptide (TPR) repeat protein